MKNRYPVIFFVFKRPATTRTFLDYMVASGIRTIYIFADAPRTLTEKVDTDMVKAAINRFSHENPTIKVVTHYASANLGLKKNITRGLTAIFREVDAAIIIEDDCLPTPDFFTFTETMLTRYRDDTRVMSINGTSTGGTFDASYDFTKYAQCWGWATWARAWRLYDGNLQNFTRKSWQTVSSAALWSPLLRWYWHTMLTMVKAGWVNTWDFQWSYAHFIHGGLAIAPSVNLIQNIGFDISATNTKIKTRVANMHTHSLTWPLHHPSRVAENQSVTRQIESSFYRNPIAILGLIRQYIYWRWSSYVTRD